MLLQRIIRTVFDIQSTRSQCQKWELHVDSPFRRRTDEAADFFLVVATYQQSAYPMNCETWIDQNPTNTSYDALTTSSVSVRRHRRHAEIRGHVRAHNASHKCRMAVKPKCRLVSSAPLTARIDLTFRAGVISNNEAEDMRGVQEKCLAAKATRVQNLRKARSMINNKAKEDAKLKALKRAIEVCVRRNNAGRTVAVPVTDPFSTLRSNLHHQSSSCQSSV